MFLEKFPYRVKFYTKVIPVSMQWIQPLLETQEASAAAAFILHPLVPPAYRILNLLTPFRCCMTLFPTKGRDGVLPWKS